MSTPLFRTGSYLIRFIQNDPPPEIRWLDGTLRISREKFDGALVEATDGTVAGTVLRASADLYEHSSRPDLEKPFIESFEKLGVSYRRGRQVAIPRNRKVMIPSFPRNAYRFYLEGLQVYEGLPAAENVTVRFRVHQYDRASRTFISRGNRVCILARIPIEKMLNEGKDDPRDVEFQCLDLKGEGNSYFSGRIIDENTGNVVGKVRVGRLADYLRAAKVEIDHVEHVLPPGAGESGVTLANKWQAPFTAAGWKIEAEVSDGNVTAPKPAEGEPVRDDGAWTLTELHQAMMLWHDSMRDETQGLDAAWTYYMLCVSRLAEFERGVMFDAGGSDAEDIPHDVIAIEADWMFPKDPPWGDVKDKKFSYTPAFFRTAMHEMGHAMGLDHNHDDNGFMNTTDAIAADAATRAKERDDAKAAAKAAGRNWVEKEKVEPFPKNIRDSFHSRDLARLRHESDARVRPDTSSESSAIIQPDTDEASPVKGLRLLLSPHLQSVPYGAPVRIQFRLENTSKDSIRVPKDFSLKSGNVRGLVIDPMGNFRTFSPVVWRMDDDKFKDLKPGPDDTYSATLLRGSEGALFRASGPHRIRLHVGWTDGDARVALSEETTVNVTSPADEDHRLSALITLATPETLLSLAVGGDHLLKGNSAIDAALNNPVLRPHYALVKAKRLAVRYRPCEKVGKSIKWTTSGGREPRLHEAFELLEDNVVLAPDEIYRVAQILVRYLQAVARRREIKSAKVPGNYDKLIQETTPLVEKLLNRDKLNFPALICVSELLKNRVDRLLMYGKLHSNDRTYKAVRKLPNTTEEIVKAILCEADVKFHQYAKIVEIPLTSIIC